ncbi:CyP450 monooxygenase [Lentinus brumalis]|uniref:CyP450 monooxygenase n=1 Tax=Lentinus brumalis TaxID=2498619 RepID=A0A371CWE6_9APHY|nr:CyP450 monooxygenase [Polyporus brumalis]
MLADSPSSWFLVAVPALAFLWWVIAGSSRAGLPLPPGPPRLPIIGNALDVPTKNMEATFRAMNEQYGDVVHLDALGQPMIVLGSHEAAVDLLEKRSANYSDRSISTMAKLCGLDWVLTLINYGPWWRRHRRTFHQFFNAAAVQEYQPSQRREAHKFVLRLIEQPKDFVHHIRHLFGSTIMRITYGIEVDEPGNESYLATVEEALAIFSAATVPGKYLVETFPVLRHVPTWFPFARFKREAREWRDLPMEVLHRPWEVALHAIKEGTAPPSMAATLVDSLSRLPPDEVEDEEAVARQTTAVVYAAGADTTLSTVQTFFLAMASNPDVQKKAQAELDAVIGPTRLPDFADQDSLPYIGALIKELLRWRSVVPLGIPHRSLEEDEYRGYRIPKGSIVISNIWAYSRDPSVYPDPEAFMPERFLKDGKLNPDVRDSATIAFGYGRRICPGRHFAEASLFVIVTTVLHTLSISAPLGGDGRPVRLEGKMTHGILSYPEPFECVIEPRSRAAETLIRTSCLE